MARPYPNTISDLLSYEADKVDRYDRMSTSPVSTLEDDSQFGVDLTGKNIAGKSFTIAAILGLSSNGQDVMNLSVQESLNQVHRDREFQYFYRHDQRIPDGYCRVGGRQEGARPPDLKGGGTAQSTPLGKSARAHTLNCSNPSSSRSKRIRTIFTPEQLERLEAEFERQQYMVGPERLYLAHALQLTEAQVKVWFQNRRIKWRKHHLEVTQQRLAVLQRHRDDVDDDV